MKPGITLVFFTTPLGPICLYIYIIVLVFNAKANREGGLQVELTSSTASDLGREIDDDDIGSGLN